MTDTPERFGFAYGTLPGHPEDGEEAFHVVRMVDETVSFEIVAFFRPATLLVRFGGPLSRAAQQRATRRYLTGLRQDGPASRDGLLAGRLATYPLVHAATVGTLVAAGFELLATFRRPHFTIRLHTDSNAEASRLLEVLRPTEEGTRTIEPHGNAETEDPDDHRRHHR